MNATVLVPTSGVSLLPQPLVGLMEHPWFVVWNPEEVNAKGKQVKSPRRADDPGKYASTRRPKTWCSWPEAQACIAAHPGMRVGYVLSQDTEHAFLDLDGCRDSETGVLAAWASEIVDAAACYTEITPSGRGLRIIGKMPDGHNPVNIMLPAHLLPKGPPEGGGPAAKTAQLEVYFFTPRYVTVTGWRLPGTEDWGLGDLGAAVEAFVALAPPRAPCQVSADVMLSDADLMMCVDEMSNPPIGEADTWDTWNTIGMAIFRASGESDLGLKCFVHWSSKNRKHDEIECLDRWTHWLYDSPPDQITGGTLRYHADRAVRAAGRPIRVPSRMTPPGGWPDHTVCDLGRLQTSPQGTSSRLETSTGGAVSNGSSSVTAFLAAEAWAEREFALPVRLLGDLVTTTTRAFLIGSTGVGKTMLGVALAAGMASGQGFLDWGCDRPARVLYLDGEMPGELVRTRVRDAMRRLGSASLRSNLFFYCADSGEVFAKMFPHLGMIHPLNTEAGQNFLYALVDALGGVDCIVFDNVMSLVSGDQKDEVPWSETLPLIAELTRRQIGQVWLDHAGHNTARQYGSSTKAWRFDVVGIMTDLPAEARIPGEMAFKLSFDSPGKARRRTPDNFREFAPRTIRLADDKWTSKRDDGFAVGERGKVSPSRAAFHPPLIFALARHPTAPGSTTMAAWEGECIRMGIIDAPDAAENGTARKTRLGTFRTARSALVAAGWVSINGDCVTNLVGKYDRRENPIQ